MGRYLNHSRYMDYTKDMAEHIYKRAKEEMLVLPEDNQMKIEDWLNITS